MKCILLILFSVLLVVLLAACGGVGEASSTASLGAGAPLSSPPGVGQTGADISSGTIGSVPPSQSAPDGSILVEEHSVTGIISSTGMGTCYVRMADGREVAFPMDGVDTSAFIDTFPDCEVIIYYYGEFNGQNTDGITVTRMVSPTVT